MATDGSKRSKALVAASVAAVLLMAWLTVKGGSVRPWLFPSHYQTGFPDLRARIAQVAGVRQGHNIYVPFGVEAFTYPPAAILLFLPLTLVALTTAYVSWTAVSILCLAGTYLVGIRALRPRDMTGDAAVSIWAAVVTVVVFPPMSETLAWGQTSTILLLLVTADLWAVSGRGRGVLVGMATAIKLYPGIIIVFWLCRRQWRAAGTAMGAALVSTAAAWLLWPASGSTFFFHVLLGGSETSHFNSGAALDKSAAVSSFFLRLGFVPRGVAVVIGVAASLVVLAIGLAVAVRLDRAGLRITSVVTLLVAGVVISPVTWDHYFTFVPLLVLAIVEVGWSMSGRMLLTALVLFTVPWYFFRQPFAVGSHVFGLPLGPIVLALASRNAFFVASMLVIVAAMVQVRSLARGRPDIQGSEIAASSATGLGEGVGEKLTPVLVRKGG